MLRKLRLPCSIALAWVLTLAGTTPTRAQEVLEVIPYAGSYMPLVSFGETRNPVASYNSVYRESIGVLAGLKARWHTSDRVALQVSTAYVRTGWWEEVKYDDATRRGVGFSLRGNVIHSAAEVLFRPYRTNVYGSAGVSYVRRGGGAWKPTVPGTEFQKNNFGFVAGIGIRAAAIPGLLSFDVTAQASVYRVEKVKAGFVFEPREPLSSHKLQTDVTVAVGVPIALLSR